MTLDDKNDRIKEFSQLIAEGICNQFEGELKVGVDLGTANTVLAVTDQNNKMIAGATHPSKSIKDGIVVDFLQAVEIVSLLKSTLEKRLGQELKYAETAIPPGITEGNIKIITNVVEASGFEVIGVVDEPTAASNFLEITDGAVVDVGGGTTGISIIKQGKVIFVADEPTGGTHMTLVLAGAKGITLEEAEILKKDKSRDREVFPVIKPVVEKMAHIVKKYLADYQIENIYLVGGACTFDAFETVFEKEIGVKTIKPIEPLLVTPMGIALSCNKG